MFQAPLRHIKPENYELMGYYQGLNSKFETLNKTKNELRFKTMYNFIRNTGNWCGITCPGIIRTIFETIQQLADMINNLQISVDESKPSDMTKYSTEIQEM